LHPLASGGRLCGAYCGGTDNAGALTLAEGIQGFAEGIGYGHTRALRNSLAAIVPHDNRVRAVEVLEKATATSSGRLRQAMSLEAMTRNRHSGSAGPAHTSSDILRARPRRAARGNSYRSTGKSVRSRRADMEQCPGRVVGQDHHVARHRGGIHYTVKVKGREQKPGEEKKDDPQALKAQDRLTHSGLTLQTAWTSSSHSGQLPVCYGCRSYRPSSLAEDRRWAGGRRHRRDRHAGPAHAGRGEDQPVNAREVTAIEIGRSTTARYGGWCIRHGH